MLDALEELAGAMLGVGTLNGGMVGMLAGAMLALLPLTDGGTEGGAEDVDAVAGDDAPRAGGRVERGAMLLLAALFAPLAEPGR